MAGEREGMPKVQRFRAPVRRTWLGAWLDAWRAVRAGVSRDAYLQARLAVYRRAAPQDATRLPYDIEIVDGAPTRVAADGSPDPRVTMLDDPAGVAPPDEASAFGAELRTLRAAARARGEALARDLGAAQEDIDRASAGLAEARERVAESRDANLAAIGDGLALATATARRSPDTRGKRAPLSTLFSQVGCAAVIVGLLAGETYQAFFAFADLMGVDTSDLPLAWETQRFSVIGCAGLAFVAVVALVVLAHWASRAWCSLRDGGHGVRRHAFDVLGLVGTLAVYGAAVWGLAVLREISTGAAAAMGALMSGQPALGAATAWQTARAVEIFTAVAPLGVLFCAHVYKAIGARAASREEERHQWDLADNARRETAERQSEQLAVLEAERSRFEARVEAGRAEMRRLSLVAQQLEEGLRAEIEAGNAYARAYLSSLESALGLDAYHYACQRARRPDVFQSVPATQEPPSGLYTRRGDTLVPWRGDAASGGE